MKQHLKNWLTRHLFCTVNIHDVFSVNDKTKKIQLNGQDLTDVEISSLKEEALFIEQTRTWKIFQETVRQMALKAGFNSSTKFEDLQTSKTMLLNLDILKNIITKFQDM